MKITNIRVPLTSDEMQPLEVFCKKVLKKVLKFCKIHRKTPEPLF